MNTNTEPLPSSAAINNGVMGEARIPVTSESQQPVNHPEWEAAYQKFQPQLTSEERHNLLSTLEGTLPTDNPQRLELLQALAQESSGNSDKTKGVLNRVETSIQKLTQRQTFGSLPNDETDYEGLRRLWQEINHDLPPEDQKTSLSSLKLSP